MIVLISLSFNQESQDSNSTQTLLVIYSEFFTLELFFNLCSLLNHFPATCPQRHLYIIPQVKVLHREVGSFILTRSPVGFCAQLKKKWLFLGVTTWMWLPPNLPGAVREETVWHDCKWRKIGKIKQSILFTFSWRAEQNNLLSHSLVFGQIMYFVSKKVVLKSTFLKK